MDIKFECLPCITRQLTTLATKVSDDTVIQKKIISYGLDEISRKAFKSSAPYITGLIYDYAKKTSGIEDPFKEEKETFNKIAEMLIDELDLKEKVAESDDPLDTAIRLSIAGNIIDFSLGIKIEENGVRDSVERSLTTNLYGSNSHSLADAVVKAKNIMVIADNAGEIVFDKLLVGLLPLEKVKYVVKGGPIVNDATIEDADAVGMDKLVDVIDNGAAIQGTVLDTCSESFIKAFEEADLVISKGQANFETLGEIKGKNIFFLLRAKCQSVADEIGCKKGEFVFLHNK